MTQADLEIETTWTEYDSYWNSPIVIHRLGDKRVIGYCAGAPDEDENDSNIEWNPGEKMHTKNCSGQNCSCSWWGGQEFFSEEEALKWLRSGEPLIKRHIR